jgi:hypothetical protein
LLLTLRDFLCFLLSNQFVKTAIWKSSHSVETPCICSYLLAHLLVKIRCCTKLRIFFGLPWVEVSCPYGISVDSWLSTIVLIVFMCAVLLCLKSDNSNNTSNVSAAKLQILSWCLFNCHFIYSYTTCFGIIFTIIRCILSDSERILLILLL